MFLTKKSGPLTHKAKAPVKNRPLAGWEDDEETPKQSIPKQPHQTHFQQINLLEGSQDPIVSSQISKKTAHKEPENSPKTFIYFNWDQLNEKTDMDCEKKLVQEIVQTGGIRIKPNDSQLSSFAKQIKGMNVNNIGSLLLSKLEVNYPFQIKAKALYTIEHLIKKDEEYQQYFRNQSDKIKDFPQPEDNVDNFRKIQKNVLNSIGVHTKQVPTVELEEKKPVYVDPHYFQEPKKSQFSSFIEQNSNKAKKGPGKKPIIGPGQAKAKLQERKEAKTVQLIEDLNEKHSEVLKICVEGRMNQKPENLLDLDSRESKNNDNELI